MRLRLDIAYDGTNFRGWARQPGLRTVQGTLEGALTRLAGSPVGLVVAGRTDSGVHATGQVAHADLDEGQWSRITRRRRASSGSRSGGGGDVHPAAVVADRGDEDEAAVVADRIDGVLHSYSDVSVVRTSTAPDGFDARFSATWRRYEYRIADRVSGYDPMQRHRTTNVRSALDAEAMNAAARTLIGLWDFAAYCKPRPEATTIRTLLDYDWRRDDDGVLIARVRADAFCHSMVRALVGGCVAVGEGRLAPERLAEIRDGGERTSAFPVLAARGLTLAEVGYPVDADLGLRAEQTRNRRNADEIGA